MTFTYADALGNPLGVGICGMTKTDVPAVLSILAESPEASAWSRESILESISSGSAWVAGQKGCVIGFLIGRAASDEFEILNMAVARCHRRRGVATQLVNAALEWSRTAGVGCAYLEVRASNGAALALYARHGFRQSGLRSRYYQYPVEDAVVLARRASELS